MFPTGPDFLVPWDKGTEVLSLSQDKGTMGQAQNLAVSGRDFDILPRDRPRQSRTGF